MSACPVCGSESTPNHTSTVLGRYAAEYRRCCGCGLLWINRPHWLNEAYASPIAATDTGLISRNLVLARMTAGILWCSRRVGQPLVDMAGGHGVLVRLLRDRGVDAWWDDPYAENIVARGFEAGQRPDELPTGGVATAFEVLEHLPDPIATMREMLDRWQPTLLIASTETIGDATPPQDWPYYSHITGQHITFYTIESLRVLGDAVGLPYAQSRGNLHVFGDTKGWSLKWAAGPLSRLWSARLARRRGSLTERDRVVLTERLQG